MLTAPIKTLLEYSRQGIVLLDATLRILAFNTEADELMQRSHLIRNHGGRLFVTDNGIRRSLQQAVARWHQCSVPEDRLVCRAEMRSGTGCYVLCAFPIRTGPVGTGPRGVELLLVVSNLAAPSRLEPRFVQNALGLTASEARVAIEIARGRAPPQIAEAMTLSAETIRTHLKRVFKKMGCRSQAQLAIILTRLALLPGPAASVPPLPNRR